MASLVRCRAWSTQRTPMQPLLHHARTQRMYMVSHVSHVAHSLPAVSVY